MTKEQALKLLHDNMESPNLRKYCYAVGAGMRALAYRLNPDKSANDTAGATSAVADRWEVVGFFRGSDGENTKGEPLKHTTLTYQWLLALGETDQEIFNAIKTHNYVHTGENPPETKMEWALYCCDELTGFIIAVTLVQPEKKLASVTSERVLKKWNKKEFAAGVDRRQIEKCETRLGIPKNEFIEIALGAMQSINDDLGL